MSKLLILLVALQCLFGIAFCNNLWGAITVKNLGGYKHKFQVTYKIDGEYRVQESGGYPVGQAQTLSIPPEAANVLVVSYVDVFINNWSVIFVDSIGTPQIKCYDVWGTTLFTAWNARDC